MTTGLAGYSQDIKALIKMGMNSKLHWFPESVSISMLASTLVGMANSDGGIVLLGVSPRAGELVGINNPEQTLDKIYQTALAIEPSLVLPIPRVVTINNTGGEKLLRFILVDVPPGLPYVYKYEDKYFYRDGVKTNPLPTKQLYQLLSERGSIQFESRFIPAACLDDLDEEAILAYAETTRSIKAVNLEKSCEFLIKRGCLKLVEGKYQVTYAAILLFGHSPQQWLPNATILAGRFPGPLMSDTFIKQDITGNLPGQLKQAEEFLRANLHTIVRMKGLTHQESLEYPFEAVRELIVNAVTHRDYNLQGDNIHLNVFSDRLVVSSPGELPGPMTLENLLVSRFARNPVITQVLSDLGYVERLGYGLDRVVSSTQREGLPLPRFEEVGGNFQVTLFSGLPYEEPKKKTADLSVYEHFDLNIRQQSALAQLAVRPRITNHEYQALCPGVHAETLRRDLADLVERGILIKVGDKKATYYILKRV